MPEQTLGQSVRDAAGRPNWSAVARRMAGDTQISTVVPLRRPLPANSPRPVAPPISASPFVWRDPATIPPREWLYDRHYIRRFVSGTVAPGGLGKSSLAIVEALAMATGRPLLGAQPRGRSRVWYWNGEDPREEIERRVIAACLWYEIRPEELDGLFIDSGRACEIIIAQETKSGIAIAEPVVERVISEMERNGIDALILDPFVSTHEVSENDNNRIARVIKTFARIADEANAAVELVHHVRKGGQGVEVTVEDGRGAAAFKDGLRSARVLNHMTNTEADRLGISLEDRVKLFRVDFGKANLAPPATQATWRRLASISLGNGNDSRPDDYVGVVTEFETPSALDGLTANDLYNVQLLVNDRPWRENVQSEDWVGHAVAETLGIEIDTEAGKARVKALLRTWLKSGALVVARRIDGTTRKERPFVEVGAWAVRTDG